MTMGDHSDLRDIFEDPTRWRREKANEHSDDKRNLDAAAIFDRLAATAAALPDEVVETFFELGADVPDGSLESERFGEFLREVGSIPTTLLPESFAGPT